MINLDLAQSALDGLGFMTSRDDGGQLYVARDNMTAALAPWGIKYVVTLYGDTSARDALRAVIEEMS